MAPKRDSFCTLAVCIHCSDSATQGVLSMDYPMDQSMAYHRVSAHYLKVIIDDPWVTIDYLLVILDYLWMIVYLFP